MKIIRKAGRTSGFAGKSNSIRKQLIEDALVYLHKMSDYTQISPKKLDHGRIDMTSETHDEGSISETILKIQVQNGKNTYASVMVRKSAVDYGERDGKKQVLNEIIQAIEASYNDQTVYEISCEEEK